MRELAVEASPLVRNPRPELPKGPYLVAGLGKAGLGAIDLLCELTGPGGVQAWDVSQGPELRSLARHLERRGVRCVLGGDGAQAVAHLEGGCVIKSPGIPMESPLVLAARRHGIPLVDELELAWRASPLPVMAVTGTKGKSTVTKLLAAVGEAAFGSSHMAGNTDFAPALSSVRAATGVVACEVSSQQLEACTDLLPEIAVFTNVHRETNRHGSAAATFDIKRTLFARGERCVPVAILNVDDPRCEDLASAVAGRGGRVVRYGRSTRADYRVLRGEWSLDGAVVELSTPTGRLELETKLPGIQNAVNSAAAVAAGALLGLSSETVVDAIATTSPPPGRYQRVDRGQPFDVVVDMAHTPLSIRELLVTLRAVVEDRPGATLRTVLGVPGSYLMTEPRERSGRIARELSDQLVVTGASLRGEPPLINMASILRGARSTSGAELRAAIDRRVAIATAIRSARPGDVIAIIGRGPISQMTFDAHGGGYRGSDAEIAARMLQASLSL